MVKVLPLFPWISAGLHWGIEMLLGYIVGAPVEIAQIEAIELRWNGSWMLRLGTVSVGSTLPGASFPVAHFHTVMLYGSGQLIDSAYLRGGELHLIRLGKLEKNFRYFPRRRESSPEQDFFFRAESIHIHLANHPPGVFLNLSVHTLQAHIHIDSLAVRIADGRTAVKAKEVCIGGTPTPFPETIYLALEGIYEKKTDLWSDVNLILAAPEGLLHFCGDIARWEEPHGHLGGVLWSSIIADIIPKSAPWLSGKKLFFTGEVKGLAYEVRLSGGSGEGSYDLCIQGEKDQIHLLSGNLYIEGIGILAISGSPERLRITGKGNLKGVSIHMEGMLNLRAARGFMRLSDAYGADLLLSGTLRQLKLSGHIGTLYFTGSWYSDRHLSLWLDTVNVETLYHALQPYMPVLRGSGTLPVEVRVSRVLWGKYGTLSGALLMIRDGRFLLTGQAHGASLPSPIDLRVWGRTDLVCGGFVSRAAEGYLYGEWIGDSADVSGIIRWEDIILEGSAYVDMARRCLWIRRAEGRFSGGEGFQLRGALMPDSADAELRGTVPLPWLLDYLPLFGFIVQEGSLRLAICAQGSWDTLLRWDNPTEGEVSLHHVRGYFSGLAVPLRDLDAHLSYSPQHTTLHTVRGQVGDLTFRADGEVLGALSYLYTDWYRLRGRLWIEADHLVVSDFWRRVEREEIRPQVRLPSQMDALIEVTVRDVDMLGVGLEHAHIAAHIEGLGVRIDTLSISYAHAQAGGRAYLDVQDSACYMLVGRFYAEGLPIERLLSDLGVGKIPTFQRLGLRGRFAGEVQFSLRFSPDVAWLRQSSFHAEGSLSGGRFHTPRFMRWLRPYYLEAYRDSMDFFAQVSGLSVTDGFLRLSKAFLLTRVAALEVSGYHYLPADRFLYRIQAVRVRRRVQRYADLEVFIGAFSHLIDRSFGLIYVEKEGGKIYWRYPWRYALRRLLIPK